MKKKLILVMSLFITLNLHGQEKSPNYSPYDVIYNHLHYLQSESYNPELASRSFLIEADSTEAISYAIKLKQVLDGQGLFVDLSKLPDDNEYFDSLKTVSSYTLFRDKLPQVYVTKIGENWYYSQQTYQSIPELHKKVYPLGSDLLINLLPKASHKKILGLYSWQYLGIFILMLIAILTFVVLNFIIKKILLNLKAISQTLLKDKSKILKSVHYLIAVLLVVQLISWLIPILQLPVRANESITLILRVLSSFLILFLAFRIFDLVVSYIEIITQKTESKMDDQLLPVITRAGQFLIIAFWIFYLFSVLNVNITALVAGFSIGGIAFALAAQDTLKNLFGSITIFLDRPFQIGDWVKFNEGEGTVEEVGFRSTRIRSFANSLIYVPNSKLADAKIDNYGLRVYRRYSTKIGITYDTPPDKIEEFVSGLNQLVKTNDYINDDNFQIHLNDLGSSALEILFYIFFDVPDWAAELKAKHNLLMDILRLAHNLGIKFAFPSQSIYIEQNEG